MNHENVYPGYQTVPIEEVRLKFEAAWGVPLSPKVGITVSEIMPAAGEGKIKALDILREDPVMSDPDSNHIRHCLETCDFIVLQEIFTSETAAFADILLPGVSFTEKTGTFTNADCRVQMVNQAIPPLLDPDDAAHLRLDEQSRVCLTSRRGSIEAEAWITDRVPLGMIFANFHFPDSPANELTFAALDPVAKIPEYKICAICLEEV